MQIIAPRGTYDVLPEESGNWQYLERIMSRIAGFYGYHEVRTPIFEHTELFQRGVGETTDIVSKEMYTFEKSGRSLTLRPEGTASCARAVIEHGLYSGKLPLKWYYHGPMFRYDRPQAGRYRQFSQFGAEAFGSGSPYLDAEVLLLLVDILVNLGLENYELHLNSVGCPACRQVYRQELIRYLEPVSSQLCSDCQVRCRQNPLRVLDCKVENCRRLTAAVPIITDFLCTDCAAHYALVCGILTDNSVGFIQDNMLVRGLDYYTNTAFEIHLPGMGAQSAIGGGGRYNGLIGDCGGPDLPGIGFALGLERILLAMRANNVMPDSGGDTEVYVVLMEEKYEPEAMRILTFLRRAGIVADKDYSCRKPKAQMKQADKSRSRLCLLVGEDEIAGGFFTLRNMSSKEQIQLSQNQLTDYIKDILRKD